MTTTSFFILYYLYYKSTICKSTGMSREKIPEEILIENIFLQEIIISIRISFSHGMFFFYSI